ncbi:MAG: tryptophan--tRNA ligase [Erysipelothrix sp.]|nr:tryptophan--tRNA ligase [Erysipelothrix sp.]
MIKKRMISAIKPSGHLTLGNYIGALANFVKYQDDFEMIVFIANLHTITVPQEPDELRSNLEEAAILYLAAGLDPAKATIFLQSDVHEHAQLGHILQCFTYLGELNRMTQYKDKVAKGETNLGVGLYTYPTLMAADILLYDAQFVPVGIDQKQHVELTRDLAERINNRFDKELFVIPEPLLEEVGTKIYDLQDPSKKMSKSDVSDKGCIYLMDDPKKARKKIMSAITDSYDTIQYDPEKQPGISNLLVIAASLKKVSVDTILMETQGMRYGDFKKYVASIVEETLTDIQSRYQDIKAQNVLNEVLSEGALKARSIASKKLKEVQSTIGIEL